MDHTDLKILMLLYENKLFASRQHVNLLFELSKSKARVLSIL